MEVDITKKVQYFMKYGLVGLILIAVVAASGIYYYQHQHKYFNVYDAQVASSLIAAKVHGNATVVEKVVADGEHVEAGDIIAHVQSKITDDDLANLEQIVVLSQRNLDEIKKGQTVTVAVPGPAPTPAASAPARSSSSSQSAAAAESRMHRMQELYEMGAVSARERDAAVAAYNSANSASSASSTPAASSSSAPAVTYKTTTQPADPKAVQAAELQLKQAQAALDNAKQDVAETDIVAPVAGTVYYADGIDEGSDVKAGQTIASVGNADDIWVEARVNSEKAPKIRLGQFVSYEIDGHELQGSVQDIQQPSKKDDSSDSSNNNGSDVSADGTNGANGNGQAGQNGQASQDGQSTVNTNDASGNPTDPNVANSQDGQNGQLVPAGTGNQDPKTTTSVENSKEDEDVLIIRISIPSGLNFDLKPGMRAIVKFAMNG